MAGDITYQAILSELLEDRANLDRMIAWVQGKMAHPEDSTAATVVAHVSPEASASAHYKIASRGLAGDSFFRMSVPDAIKKYLNMAKRPKTAKDITAALDSGGLTHQAKNLYATVYPTLLRMEKANEVARVSNGEWGLTEWYGGRKGSQEEKVETDK